MLGKLVHGFGAKQALNQDEVNVQCREAFVDGVKIVGQCLQHRRRWIRKEMHNLEPRAGFVGLNVLGNCSECLQRRVLGKEDNLGVVNFINSSSRVAVKVRAHELWEVLAVEVREDAE